MLPLKTLESKRWKIGVDFFHFTNLHSVSRKLQWIDSPSPTPNYLKIPPPNSPADNIVYKWQFFRTFFKLQWSLLSSHKHQMCQSLSLDKNLSMGDLLVSILYCLPQ